MPQMGNIPAEAAPAPTLTEFEAQCADLDAKDYNPRQIACVLEKGEGAVRQALRNAQLKLAAGRCEVAETRREAARARRDLEQAAHNYYTEEIPQVNKAGEAAEPFIRWWWPFEGPEPVRG